MSSGISGSIQKQTKVIRRVHVVKLKRCTSCIQRRIKCNGILPCNRCVKSGKECVFGNAVGEEEEEERGGAGAAAAENSKQTEVGRESPIIATTPSTTESSSSSSSSSPQTTTSGKRMSTEIVLADSSSAVMMMNIFAQKFLPLFKETYLLGETSSIPFTIYDETESIVTKMQRDAALAVACRASGHHILAKLLIERMDHYAALVADVGIGGFDAVNAYVLYYTLVAGGNSQRGLQIAPVLFNLHRAAVCNQINNRLIANNFNNNDKTISITKSVPADIDPIAALCDPLKEMDLNEDPLNDGVSPDEIVALVLYGAEQLRTWSQTLENPQLRGMLHFFIQWRSRIIGNLLSPGGVVFMNLVFDCHFLGILVPKQLEEALRKHDPQGRFSPMGLRSSSDVIAEPIHLSSEVGDLLLRRADIARRLVLLAKLSPETQIVHSLPGEALRAAIYIRMGNMELAKHTARSTIQIASAYDLNFWPPMNVTFILLLGCVFYEAGDLNGIDMVGKMFEQMQRSNPSVVCAMAALMELRTKALEQQEEKRPETPVEEADFNFVE